MALTQSTNRPPHPSSGSKKYHFTRQVMKDGEIDIVLIGRITLQTVLPMPRIWSRLRNSGICYVRRDIVTDEDWGRAGQCARKTPSLGRATCVLATLDCFVFAFLARRLLGGCWREFASSLQHRRPHVVSAVEEKGYNSLISEGLPSPATTR